jgi:hypothetical protein
MIDSKSPSNVHIKDAFAQELGRRVRTKLWHFQPLEKCPSQDRVELYKAAMTDSFDRQEASGGVRRVGRIEPVQEIEAGSSTFGGRSKY